MALDKLSEPGLSGFSGPTIPPRATVVRAGLPAVSADKPQHDDNSSSNEFYTLFSCLWIELSEMNRVQIEIVIHYIDLILQ